MYFPKISLEKFKEINVFEDRLKWDPRWESARTIANEGENCKIIYVKTKRLPCIPRVIVASRDQLLRFWTGIEDGNGPGISCMVSYSIEHPAVPIDKSKFPMAVRQHYEMMMSGVERHGTGIKFIQCKTIDMGGWLLTPMKQRGSRIMPSYNFKCWCDVLDKVARGESLVKK